MASNANLTTVESLRIALAELGLETNGHKPELKRRLRKAREKKAAEERAAAKARSEQVEKTNVDEEEKSAAAGEAKEEQIIIPNKNKSESSVIPKEQPLDYYLFFDVEATCEANGGFTFPNEIIEFPVVLVDGKTFEIVCRRICYTIAIDCLPNYVNCTRWMSSNLMSNRASTLLCRIFAKN